jgi:hypothetical protein
MCKPRYFNVNRHRTMSIILHGKRCSICKIYNIPLYTSNFITSAATSRRCLTTRISLNLRETIIAFLLFNVMGFHYKLRCKIWSTICFVFHYRLLDFLLCFRKGLTEKTQFICSLNIILSGISFFPFFFGTNKN